MVTPTGLKFSSRFLTMLFSQLTSVSIQFSAEVMFSKTMLGKKTVSISDGLSLFNLLSFFRFQTAVGQASVFGGKALF